MASRRGGLDFGEVEPETIVPETCNRDAILENSSPESNSYSGD